MRAAALCLAALLAVGQARAQDRLALLPFESDTQMAAVLRLWRLDPADVLDRRSVNYRLAGFAEMSFGRLRTGERDCRIFQPERVPCRLLETTGPHAVPIHLVTGAFEALPAERYALLDVWEGPLGYATRVEPLSRRKASLIGGEATRPAYRRMNGRNFPGSTMEIGLSLVPIDRVSNGSAAWQRLERLADDATPFSCRQSDDLCHVAVRLGHAGQAGPLGLIGICRAFRRSRGSDELLLPRDCRIAAAEIAGVRHVLAVTEIWSQWEGGGGFDGVLAVEGLTEAGVREVLALSLERLGLARVGAPRTARIIGETPTPVRDAADSVYRRREITASWSAYGNEFVVDLSVVVVESRLNTNDRWLLRSDLERAAVEDFRAAVRAELSARCGRVRADLGGDVPRLVCVRR